MNDHARDRARPAPPRRADGSPTAAPTAGESPPGAMELLQLVMSTADVESYLHEVAVMADDLDPAIGGVGMTLRRDGRVLSVATSNLLAASVDEVQYGMD